MHLYLGDSAADQFRNAVFATSPNAALELLKSGVVSEVTFCRDWRALFDPCNEVVLYIDDAVRCSAIPMLAWRDLGKEQGVYGRLSQLDDFCRARGEATPLPDSQIKYALACGLNPRMTLDVFKCHEGNAAAYGFATLVAISCRRERNPLLICGPADSGKTHLLNAIGNRWLDFNAGANVLCRSATEVRRSQTIDLMRAPLELLLIDDLHQHAGEQAAQQVINKLAQSLRNRAVQIVFTIRTKTNELPGIDKALAAFFNTGIAVMCQPPGN